MSLSLNRFAALAALLATVAWLLLCAGCASSSKKSAQGPATAAPAWLWPPDEPEPPRAVYVQSLSRPSDAGVKASGFSRVARWLTGREKGGEPLQKPFGAGLDENDNLCFTDTAANALFYVDRVKKQWRRWDKFGKLRLLSPVAVAAHKGVFYVADSARASVLAISDHGKLLFQITNKLERPSGLCISNQRLYVTDSKRHCVVSFDLNGAWLAEFGKRGTGPEGFNFPTHITADAAGHLYVTDSMNSRVVVLDSEGKFLSEIGSAGDSTGHFSRPKGVAVDSFGHVYVIDSLFDNIQVFDQQGRFLMTLGESGSQPGQFWLPNGIAISRKNEIYITDAYNHRVQILQYVGPP
jgi:sugar lactone lactonase YvrE